MDISMLLRKKRKLLNLLLKINQLQRINQIRNKEKKRKRVWIRACILGREIRGEASILVQEMRFRDVVWYYNYTRMMPDSFDELLNLIEPIIRKQETNCRKPIPPAIRLLITLRYLASGDLMSSLAMSYRSGKSTVSGIIQETCEAIWETLQHRVLFQPSQQRWKEIADDFSTKWNFPHCIGAVDGKHVVIQAPPYAGSTFYNYKGQHSIVLMAIVSASYEFLMVDIGAQGRHHDGGIFKGSIMGQRFENRQMELPPPCSLPNSNILVPYILVGDAAFQLNEYTLRPYPGNRLNRIREIFNKRLSCVKPYAVTRYADACCKSLLASILPVTPDNTDHSFNFTMATPVSVGALSQSLSQSQCDNTTNNLLLRLTEQLSESNARLSEQLSESNARFSAFVEEQRRTNTILNDKLDKLNCVASCVERNSQRIVELEQRCDALVDEIRALKTGGADSHSVTHVIRGIFRFGTL
ncbi:uncharacterized protein [Temnothorax longispinosus]|uniref:uncharacterized protein n=1 Tax=Temnothorax longispinosus TaxID=300112 RepID=UPI003A997B96